MGLADSEIGANGGCFFASQHTDLEIGASDILQYLGALRQAQGANAVFISVHQYHHQYQRNYLIIKINGSDNFQGRMRYTPTIVHCK